MGKLAFLTITMAIALSFSARGHALAQTNSSRTVRMIVPAAPGGAIDAYARLISAHMAKTLGRVIIIEHKIGGGANLAAQFVVDAPPDGSLILVGTQGMMEINPSAYSDRKWSVEHFNPLIRGVKAPLLLVTHHSVPAKTLTELVGWIRMNPGKLSYSSYSPGTPSHFLGYQMKERFGLDLAHVPYRGSALQANDLMAGHSSLGFAQVQATLAHIAASKLNVIASTGEARSRWLPHVTTFAELGHPEFTANIWFGLMVRTGTPPEVVERLLDAAKAAHTDAEIRSKLEAQGFEISGQSGPQFILDIKAQIERWARLVKASGFKADSTQ
jgi:tripartite-type tricarboxylate transporter receptor subunit TctC